MENLKQMLIELMADFLDNEDTIYELQKNGLVDPEEDKSKSEIHIKMAEKAFYELKDKMLKIN